MWSSEDDPERRAKDRSHSCVPPLLPLQHNLTQDEDDAFHHLFVRPSSSSLPQIRFKKHSSPDSTSHWTRSSTPAISPSKSLDFSDYDLPRKWSSFTQLSSGTTRGSSFCYTPGGQGSLDRGLLYGDRKRKADARKDFSQPVSSSVVLSSLLQSLPNVNFSYKHKQGSRSTGVKSDPFCYSSNNHDDCLSSSTQDNLSEPQNSDRSFQIQPDVRTQMWLNEQMAYRPNIQSRFECSEKSDLGKVDYYGKGLSPSKETSIAGLVKLNKGLLRQRDLEIDRQKQQILHLEDRIKENKHKARQVLDNSIIPNTVVSTKKVPDRLCCGEQLGMKLALAELEVLHFNMFFKQVNQKYTDDIKKLDEKIKTRDRYITSLKKKCQRESEQNQEKQQRIETLEKYLSDLPTQSEVRLKFDQQEELRQKTRHLKDRVFHLQRTIEKEILLIKEKEIIIQMQGQREKELILSIQSLHEKVQECLDDGVRGPMQDMKHLEVENVLLLQQQEHSSQMLRLQNKEIERLTSKLMDKGMLAHLSSHVRMSEVEQLLSEMKLCLHDLQVFCRILVQRAQGKEPNLSLLFGNKALGVSAEDSGSSEDAGEEELSLKLLEVDQLRRQIYELRRNISDCYAQCTNQSCGLC